MTAKRQSKALKFLENVSGRPLSFGGLLESIRMSEEMTLAVFSSKLKISASHLCDIEKGRKTVSPARASEFARVLKKSESQFVRLSLQDEVNRAGLSFKVNLEVA